MKVSEMFPDRGAGKKVQMPTRASELGGVWRGKITDVTEETGVSKGRKWTKYHIFGEPEIAFGTFSHSNGLLAKCAKEGGDVVEVQWMLGAFGKEMCTCEPVEVPVCQPTRKGR